MYCVAAACTRHALSHFEDLRDRFTDGPVFTHPNNKTRRRITQRHRLVQTVEGRVKSDQHPLAAHFHKHLLYQVRS